MFEDSLIESGGKLKTKRGWTSIVSFLIQFMIIGVMVLIPLIFTEALPKTVTLVFLVAPPPPPPPPPPPAAAPVKIVKQIQTDIVNGELRTPTKIPKKVQMIKEDEAPPPVMASTGVVGGVPGGVPGGSMGGVIGSVLSSTPVAVPKDCHSAARTRFVGRAIWTSDPQGSIRRIRHWRVRLAFRARCFCRPKSARKVTS